MCWPSWETPYHTGLQPAALCSLERGALGRVLSYMRDWHQEEECHLPRGRGVSGPCCSVLVEGPANPHGALCTRGLPCVPWPGLACWLMESML